MLEKAINIIDMKLLFTYLLISTVLFAQAQFKSNLKDLELRGKVKSLTEIEIQVIDSEQSELRRYSCSFDLQGNKTEDKYSDAQGQILYRSTYKYDREKRLLESTTLDKDAKLVGKQTFSYIGGKITEKTETATQTLQLTGEYEFDKQGNLLKHVEREGELILRTIAFTYNKAKCKTAEHIKSNNGEELFFRYTCDAIGRTTMKKQVDNSGKELFRTTYKYNTQGNLSSESSAYAGESEQTDITHQYQYDKYGNWTERKETMNGMSFLIISRIIQYY
jgi:hypothetical protein